MQSQLDRAHAAMTAAPQDDAARLAWFAALADAELVLWLETEAEGDRIAPRVFPLEDGPVVLAFDGEHRLAAAAGAPVPYAALPGRVIAQALAGQGVSLGVNLGTEADYLVPPQALDWLVATLGHGPEPASARPVAFAPPAVPPVLAAALAARLSALGGLASAALLAAVTYDGGRRGHMLALLDTRPGDRAALARAVSEALVFSGVEAGELDVAFPDPGPATDAMARAALRLDLTPPPPPAPTPRRPPGTDAPPRLR